MSLFFLFECINILTMITVCPHCGFSLSRELIDGMTSCQHCNRIFESNCINRLLAGAWSLRRENTSFEQFKFDTKLNDYEAILIYAFIVDHGYSHDEFIKALKNLGVSNKIA